MDHYRSTEFQVSYTIALHPSMNDGTLVVPRIPKATLTFGSYNFSLASSVDGMSKLNPM